jgi:hypothetical protein
VFVHTYQKRSSPDPCSEIVKLITCVVADETLDGRGVLRARDSELRCDPRHGIGKFHEREHRRSGARQPMSKYSAAIKPEKNGYCVPDISSGFFMKRKPTVLVGLILAVLEAVVDFERDFLLASDLL